MATYDEIKILQDAIQEKLFGFTSATMSEKDLENLIAENKRISNILEHLKQQHFDHTEVKIGDIYIKKTSNFEEQEENNLYPFVAVGKNQVKMYSYDKKRWLGVWTSLQQAIREGYIFTGQNMPVQQITII